MVNTRSTTIGGQPFSSVAIFQVRILFFLSADTIFLSADTIFKCELLFLSADTIL